MWLNRSGRRTFGVPGRIVIRSASAQPAHERESWRLRSGRLQREDFLWGRDELKEDDQVLEKVLVLEGSKIKLSRRAILKEQHAKVEEGSA
jgi:hypothetical protein